jgi:hypothetical protein
MHLVPSIETKENAMIFFHHTSCLSVVEKATTSSIGHSSKFPSSFNYLTSIQGELAYDFGVEWCSSQNEIQHRTCFCFSKSKAPPHFV